jgi:hypothetical protein
VTEAAPEPKSDRRRVSALLAVAGAAVAVLVGLTTLFDWFEGKTSEPTPPTIDARLQSAVLQQEHNPLGQYLSDNGQSLRGLTKRELTEQGLVFAVRVRLRGHAGDKMGLRWRMFTAAGRALPADIYSQRAGWFTPANEDHARTVPFWTPYPSRPGRYLVRFTLLDSSRQPLDVRTVAFRVTKVPSLG